MGCKENQKTTNFNHKVGEGGEKFGFCACIFSREKVAFQIDGFLEV